MSISLMAKECNWNLQSSELLNVEVTVYCQSENTLRSGRILLYILSQHLFKGLKIGTETARASYVLSREYNPVCLTHKAMLLTFKLLRSFSLVRLGFKLLLFVSLRLQQCSILLDLMFSHIFSQCSFIISR
jgi:hypothetical protein